MNDLVEKNTRQVTWDDLQAQANAAENDDDLKAVINQFVELQDDYTESVSFITAPFNKGNRAAQVGSTLMDKHISFNQGANLFEGDFFDQLLNAANGHEAAAQIVVGMGDHLDVFKDAMQRARQNYELEKVAYFFDYIDCYLDEDIRSDKRVSGVINDLIRSYQDSSQYFFDSALVNDDAIMFPYKGFKDILEDDVRDRISKQVLRTAERSAELAAIHLYRYNNQNYEEFARNMTVDADRFVSEDADIDTRLAGIGDLSIILPKHAFSMIDHLKPEDEQQALRYFNFAIEYCNREADLLTGEYQKWQKILDERLQKILPWDSDNQPAIQADNLEALNHNPVED